DNPLEEFTTAIFGLAKSSSRIPMASHCARRTAHRVEPGSNSLLSLAPIGNSCYSKRASQRAAATRHAGAHLLRRDRRKRHVLIDRDHGGSRSRIAIFETLGCHTGGSERLMLGAQAASGNDDVFPALRHEGAIG